MKDKMTRVEFLQSLALIGFGVVSSGALISSCGGGGEEESTQTASRPKQRRPKESTSPADPCADVGGLTDTELTMRNETLKYVAESPEPGKRCDNCKFWEPAANGASCGGCQLIKGPINPKGYCTSWFIEDA